MKQNTPREVAHGAYLGPTVPLYTEAELVEINRRFDRQNGFDLKFPTVFQNHLRRPESHVGRPETLWKSR